MSAETTEGFDLAAIEARLAATRRDMGIQALSSYTGARGSLPITDVDALIAEVKALRDALRGACSDGWADGRSAFDSYLREGRANVAAGKDVS